MSLRRGLLAAYVVGLGCSITLSEGALLLLTLLWLWRLREPEVRRAQVWPLWIPVAAFVLSARPCPRARSWRAGPPRRRFSPSRDFISPRIPWRPPARGIASSPGSLSPPPSPRWPASSRSSPVPRPSPP